MAVVSVRELHNATSEILEKVRKGGAAVVTKHGKPVAIIQPLSEEEFEDFILLHHPPFREALEEALKDREAGRVASLEEVKSRLDISHS